MRVSVMLCMNPNKEKVVDIYDFKVHNIKGHEGKITKCTYNVEMRRKKNKIIPVHVHHICLVFTLHWRHYMLNR